MYGDVYEPPEPEVECRDCDGTGYIDGEDGEDRTCPRCDGSGAEPLPEYPTELE